jgi:hypothetical protein
VLPASSTGRATVYLSLGALFVVASYCGSWYFIDSERQRRHQSIARDIERERWRRKQLGLPSDVDGDDDDGFAKRYFEDKAHASDVRAARTSIAATIKALDKPAS